MARSLIAHDDVAHLLDRTRDYWESLRGERVFLSGGTGFVGSWLLDAFAAANRAFALGAQAVVLTRDPAVFARKAPHLAADEAIRLQRGHAGDFAWPGGTFAFMFHAATERWIEPSAAHPAGALDADIGTTRHMLEFARTARTRRFVFTSSGAVYGRQPPELDLMPETYAGAPDVSEPRAAYGEAKRVSEYLCLRYAEQYDFVSIVARLFAFVGPRLALDEGYAVGNFVADAVAGRTIAIAGDGTPYRSYLYAADLAIWLWRMLLLPTPSSIYNVGSADAVTILELAELVRDVTGRRISIDVAKTPMPGVRAARYVPDTRRARQELGLDADISLRDGIARMYAWAQTVRPALAARA